MAWVAVDKDCEEYIYGSKPNRRSDWLLWETDINDDSMVLLPKGTIKVLIGRELTWEDESVELKEIVRQQEF